MGTICIVLSIFLCQNLSSSKNLFSKIPLGFFNLCIWKVGIAINWDREDHRIRWFKIIWNIYQSSSIGKECVRQMLCEYIIVLIFYTEYNKYFWGKIEYFRSNSCFVLKNLKKCKSFQDSPKNTCGSQCEHLNFSQLYSCTTKVSPIVMQPTHFLAM